MSTGPDVATLSLNQTLACGTRRPGWLGRPTAPFGAETIDGRTVRPTTPAGTGEDRGSARRRQTHAAVPVQLFLYTNGTGRPQLAPGASSSA